MFSVGSLPNFVFHFQVLMFKLLFFVLGLDFYGYTHFKVMDFMKNRNS